MCLDYDMDISIQESTFASRAISCFNWHMIHSLSLALCYALTIRLDNVDNTALSDGGVLSIYTNGKISINASSFTSKSIRF